MLCSILIQDVFFKIMQRVKSSSFTKMPPVELCYEISESTIGTLTHSDNTGCCQHFWNCEYNVNNVNDMYSESLKWKQMRLAGRQVYLQQKAVVPKQQRFRAKSFSMIVLTFNQKTEFSLTLKEVPIQLLKALIFKASISIGIKSEDV